MRFGIHTLDEYKLQGKTVLCRVDMNQPVDRATDTLKSVQRITACAPTINRQELYSRIDRRVDMMLEMGLEAETRALLSEGVFDRNATAAQAIGYKELLGYIRGEETLEAAVDRLKMATRRYAKRQITWFSSKEYVTPVWVRDAEKEKTFEDIVNIAEKLFFY